MLQANGDVDPHIASVLEDGEELLWWGRPDQVFNTFPTRMRSGNSSAKRSSSLAKAAIPPCDIFKETIIYTIDSVI